MSFIKIATCVSITFSAALSQADCLSDAQAAKVAGSNHLVISFEGLMGGVKGRAYRLATTSVTTSNSKAHVQAYSHAGGPNASLGCIAKWKQVHGANLKLTVVGHSFGGNAAMRLADALKSQNTTIENLIVIDGRDGSESMMCRSLGKTYTKPTNVTRAVAIYQSGCMAGRAFQPGPGVENIQEASGPLAHINLPSTNGARKAMTAALTESTTPSETYEEETVTVEQPAGNAESPAADTTVTTVVRRPVLPKVYKCELKHVPGVFQECSREERLKQDRIREFNR